MKNLIHFCFFFSLSFLFIPQIGKAQVLGSDNHWSDRREAEVPQILYKSRVIIPDRYRLLSLDLSSYKTLLKRAPLEKPLREGMILELPMPDQSLKTFRIVEDPVMAADLQARVPQIRTFRGEGVDDPTETVHLDFTPQGFHAMIMSFNHKTVYIDPFSKGNEEWYISYYKGEQSSRPYPNWTCSSRGKKSDDGGSTAASTQIGDCQIRTYELALACTGEYAEYHSGSAVDVLGAMTTTLNRVNEIFLREASIQFELVSNNIDLVYLDPATDPYDLGVLDLEEENQVNIDMVIGSGNYDIGHVFDVSNGGAAVPGTVCNSTNKAKAYSGWEDPIGDEYNVGVVCHEFGHQFSARHTFYSDEGSCSGRMNDPTAVEPGSGSTIMAYANLCDPDNVQGSADDYFHTISLQQIGTFALTTTCAVTSTGATTIPIVDALDDVSLPEGNIFSLGGEVTYGGIGTTAVSSTVWEQVDAHPGGLLETMPPDPGAASGPNFRSVPPVLYDTHRTFGLDPNYVWEGLPVPLSPRTLTFQMTSRIIESGAGCVAFDEKEVSIAYIVGPLEITSPSGGSTSWVTGSQVTITWDVAYTDDPPIDVDEVLLILEADGVNYLLTWPTANDGIETITVPASMPAATNATLRIQSFSTALGDQGASFRAQFSPITVTNFTGSGSSSKFAVFPNPATDQVKVRFQANQLREEAFCPEQYYVSDQSGKIVLQGDWGVGERSLDLDVSGFQNGIYSISVFDCQGINHQQKITVMR